MPKARWVAGFKTIPASQLLLDAPQYPCELYSDDADALTKVKALVEGTRYPVAATGPLSGARKNEGDSWAFFNQMVSLYLNNNYYFSSQLSN